MWRRHSFWGLGVALAWGTGLVAFGADKVAWPPLGGVAQAVYDAVWEPRVVAVPHADAGPGCLRVTTNGILRSFGRIRVGTRTIPVVQESRDRGLNWTTREATDADVILVRCPWSDIAMNVGGPASNRADFGWCWRRRPEADGREVRTCAPVPGLVSYGRLRTFPRHRRWFYSFSTVRPDGAIGYVPRYLFSDDDGAHWSAVRMIADTVNCAAIMPPDAAHRWDVGCNESDAVEWRDGRISLVARTGTDHACWYDSADGGATWGPPHELPAFWMTNVMPLLLRLQDGRVIFFWNNAQILPKRPAAETPELSSDEIRGRWESVFTNRDVLHAAITEDDGKTWIGFREIALSAIRNREDYRESGNEFWQMRGGGGIDKSVHQADAVELPDGKIAILYGQSVASRRVALFDVRWLYETFRTEELRRGTEHLSNHLYLKSLLGGYRGWSGHCALNRVAGAAMVREPDTDARTRRECLQICRIRDERLVDDHQGVVWNFPAARRGTVSFECRIDGAGVLVSLCDHWINPCDWAIRSRAAFAQPLEADALGGAGRWQTVTLAWDRADGTVTLSANGGTHTFPLRREGFSPYGLSYLHLQTLATGHDPKGTYLRWMKMTGDDRR